MSLSTSPTFENAPLCVMIFERPYHSPSPFLQAGFSGDVSCSPRLIGAATARDGFWNKGTLTEGAVDKVDCGS
jgi:hypothetical protein